MKKTLVVMGLIMCLVVISGGGLKASELRIITWKDYIAPELVEKFEQTYNCNLVITDYLSLDVMADTFYNNPESFDLIITTEWMIPQLIKDGMLEKLDKSKLSNFKNLHPWFLDLPFDTGNNYSIPWNYSFIGLVYNKEKVNPDDVNLKNIFEASPELTGRISFYPNDRLTIGMALKYIGKSINSTDKKDLDFVKLLLTNLKNNSLPNAWDLNRAVVDPGLAIVNGEADLTVFYASKRFVVGFLGFPDVFGFKIADEGGVLGSDNMLLVNDAINLDLAYKFIDFMLVPEHSAIQVETIGWPTPVLGVEEFLDPQLATELFPPASLLKKFEFLNPISAEEMKIYSDLWNEIK